jgi:hypothetical protein
VGTIAPVRKALLAPLAALVLVTITPAVPAALAATSPAVADCNAHGALTRHYSVGELRTALATMPSDIQEYTDCYNVIHNELLTEIPSKHVDGAGTSSSSGGGSFLPTPLLVVLIVLVVGGLTAGGVAIQRRGGT